MRHEETLKVAFTFHDLISTKHGSTSLSIRACYFPVFPLSSIPIALFTPCAVLCAVLFCYFPVVLLASSCPPRVQCCSVTLLSSLSLLHVHLVCSAVLLLSCLPSLFFMSTSCIVLCAVLFCYFPVSLLSSSCPPRVQCSSVTLLSSFSLLHVHLVCSAAPLSFLSLFSLLHVHLVCSAVPLLSCLSSLFFMSTSCAALFCCFPVSLLSSSCPSRVQCCSVTLLSSLSLLHVHLVYSAVCSAVPLLSCLSSLFFMSTSCAALLLFLSCLPSLFFPHHVAHPVCSAASSGKQVSKIASSPSACRFPSDAAPLLPRPSSSLCACLRVPPACSVVPSDDAWQAGAQVASYTSSPSAWPFPSYIPSRSIFTR